VAVAQCKQDLHNFMCMSKIYELVLAAPIYFLLMIWRVIGTKRADIVLPR
jgi:hypothetical protein